MNILLISRAFYPSCGGLETITRELAEAWAADGHQVRVVTLSPLGGYPELHSISVLRRPGLGTLVREVVVSDVVVQSGVSLRSMPIPLSLGKPTVVIHHALLDRREGWLGVRNALKRHVSRCTHNVAVSRAVARHLPGRVEVIPNAFRSARPVGSPVASRSGLLFVGRLVSDKGCDVAIEALAQLRACGLDLELAVCGDGPERAALESLACERGVERHVHFRGRVDDWPTLVRAYSTAAVAVIPSRNEPFGIVALEAIAAGCVPVASRVGGLPEAIGPCGLLVAPDDPVDLAGGIQDGLLSDVRAPLLAAAPEHLARHSIERVSQRYLAMFDEILAGRRNRVGSSTHQRAG